MEAYGPGSGRPGNNVCVVGTGVTGLLAVKNLVEQGLSVRALEQSENLGGNWYHSMDTEQVSALPETKVNISKETVSGREPETLFGYVARETYQEMQTNRIALQISQCQMVSFEQDELYGY